MEGGTQAECVEEDIWT